MREIKFRAWDKIEKKMSRPFNPFIDIENGYEEGHNIHCSEFSLNYVEDILFMQYTGLKDKSGREICEGDIVKHSGNSSYGGVVKFGKHYTQWDDYYTADAYGWYVQCEEKNTSTMKLQSEYHEVIGNIYENPELLGKETE